MRRSLLTKLAAVVSALTLLALLALPAGAQGVAAVSVSPAAVVAGATVSIEINNLWGAENVGIWFTGPSGVVVAYTKQIVTDTSGHVAFAYQTPTSLADGTWMATVQGLSSKRMEVGSFTLAAP